MKIKLIFLLLVVFSKINAQNNYDTAKLKPYPIVVENRFILPEYKNQILDAEHFFRKPKFSHLIKV